MKLEKGPELIKIGGQWESSGDVLTAVAFFVGFLPRAMIASVCVRPRYVGSWFEDARPTAWRCSWEGTTGERCRASIRENLSREEGSSLETRYEGSHEATARLLFFPNIFGCCGRPSKVEAWQLRWLTREPGDFGVCQDSREPGLIRANKVAPCS